MVIAPRAVYFVYVRLECSGVNFQGVSLDWCGPRVVWVFFFFEAASACVRDLNSVLRTPLPVRTGRVAHAWITS